MAASENDTARARDTLGEAASDIPAPDDGVGRELPSESEAGQAGAGNGPERAVAALRKVATGLARAATGMGEERSAASDMRVIMRIVEARLFATDKALTTAQLADGLPDSVDAEALLKALQEDYAERGVNLVRAGGKWQFRTAPDLGYLLEKHAVEERRLSRAALETLAIIAYHQPTTRAEIEEVRGVTTSRGTLDALMQLGWVRPRGRRRAPGKPVTYGTTDEFLQHFGLDTLGDLPGLLELKGAGLLDATLPPDFRVPQPKELAALLPDELPLEDDEDEDEAGLALEDELQEQDVDGNEDGDAADCSDGMQAAPGSMRGQSEARRPEE